MRWTSLILVFVILSCENSTTNQYLLGLPIEHADGYLTTKESFGSFYLHSWTHDTLFRFCGQEIRIEPKDSTQKFSLEVIGAQKIGHAYDDYRFTLEPRDSIVVVTILSQSKDILTKTFVVTDLPPPSLTEETFGDSVILRLEQKNKRALDLFPKDSRYGFEWQGKMTKEIRVLYLGKANIEWTPKRANYRNNIVDTKM